MAYRQSSAAPRLDGSPQRRYREQPRRDFEVIEGAALDARARQGVSTSFISKIKIGLVFGVILLALCFARVFITSSTVSVLKANSQARSDIKIARSTRADLEVQRSVLAASSRIDRIARQNLGMVLTSATEAVDVADSFKVQGESEASSVVPQTAATLAAASSITEQQEEELSEDPVEEPVADEGSLFAGQLKGEVEHTHISDVSSEALEGAAINVSASSN